MASSPTATLADQIAALQEGMVGQIPPEVGQAFAGHAAALSEVDFAARTPAAGAPAPAFELPNAVGQPIALANRLAQGPVVLTFYRGEWCPYCNLQLRAYQAALPEIADLGASLIAVSPQTPDHSLSMAERNELAFDVLSDAGAAVAERYGLTFEVTPEMRATYLAVGSDLPAHNGDDSWTLTAPGTFVIAPDGTIALSFVDGDYTRRLEPGAILDALRELG